MRRLAAAAAALAVGVIVLGGFVRLSDAGLGCPDWPGCYGKMTVDRDAVVAIGADPVKAWIEMIHRYAAGLLGLLIAWVGHRLWRHERRPWVALLLVGLVGFQAALGRWTVTLLLEPYVVLLHLLGGLSIAGILLWLAVPAPPVRGPAKAGLPLLFLAVLTVQIVLGGWTSANYAALACPDFPTCQGLWWPAADFGAALQPVPVGSHDLAALTAIHWSHRLWAVVVLSVGLATALALRQRGHPKTAALLAALLAGQFLLGVGNVVLGLPLVVAVAHNGGAVLLVLTALYAIRSAGAVRKAARGSALAALRVPDSGPI